MKSLLWTCFFSICIIFVWATVFGPWNPKGGVPFAITILFFTGHPPGALWMVFYAVRHEKKVAPYVFLAMVPYSWVWYYFERVRQGKADRIIGRT